MKKTLTSAALLLLLPLAASAQELGPLHNLVNSIGRLVGALVPILITLALVAFFWGLVKYLLKSGGKGGAAAAKDLMIWGLVSLFVMVSVWGIVRLAQNALGVNPNERAYSPQVLVPR